jgi:hypothetical protein
MPIRHSFFADPSLVGLLGRFHPLFVAAGAALCVLTGSALLIGCSSSAQVSESYRDPAYTGGPVTKVAVFWVGADERVRRVAESEISNSFGGGTACKASSEIIPTEALRDTAKIAAFLTKEGFDAVLVSRPVQPTEKITYRGKQYNPTAFMGNYGFYSYWSTSFAQLSSPGYIKDEEIFRIDTRLYLLSSRATPLWAGVSSAGDVSSLRDGIADYANTVLNSLRAEGLVK